MKISHLDHLVLTVADIPTTTNFYEKVLGMKAVSIGAGRIALEFGHQKINLHRLCCVIRFRSRVALLRLIVSQYGKF